MKPAELAKNIKDASHILAHLDSEKKNRVLRTLNDLISEKAEYIISENKRDIEDAENANLQKSLIERLKIDGKVIKEMKSSIEDVIALPDPVGEVTKLSKRPNGLLVGISVAQKTFASDSDTVTVPYTKKNSGNKIRVFVWNTKMKSYTSSVSQF